MLREMGKKLMPILTVVIVLTGCGIDNGIVDSSDITSDNVQEERSPVDNTNSSSNTTSNNIHNESDPVVDSTITNNQDNDRVLETNDIISRGSEKQMNQLITTSYSREELIEFIDYYQADNFTTTMDALDKKFPIQCVRTFPDSMPYSIYKLKDGGLIYIFYRSGYGLFLTEYVFCVNELMKKEDFDKVEIGDSLSSVESIDEGTKIIDSIKSDYLRGRQTLHLVNGGIVKIEYTSEFIELDKFKVSSVQFIPNGEDLNGNKYTILPQDYPQ